MQPGWPGQVIWSKSLDLMRFLADENFRLDVIKFLKSEDHDVELVLPRSSDESIVTFARKTRRILLTHDTDFSITLKFPPREYSGILIFRIHPPAYEKLKLAIKYFLTARNENEIKGKTFLIDDDSFVELQ